MKRIALAVLATFVVSGPAFAQDEPPDDDLPDPDDFGGDTTEMPVDDSSPAPFEGEGTPSGAEEDPDAPTLITRSADDGADEATAAYPLELQRRPILLQGGMSQVSYVAGIGALTEKRSYPKRLDDEDDLSFFRAGGVLSAEYGITDKIQLGLHYGTGTFGSPETPLDPDADAEYVTGKAVGVAFHYGLFNWMAIQAEVPLLLDPFEMALTLGAPMKFKFGDKLALFFGEDLLTFRFTDMVPFVEDAISNERSVVLIDETGAQKDNGDITVKGGVIYQLSPQLAFRGHFGIVAGDFSMDDAGTLLWGDLVYALSNKLDLMGRTGFANLGAATETFTAAAGIAFRI